MSRAAAPRRQAALAHPCSVLARRHSPPRPGRKELQTAPGIVVAMQLPYCIGTCKRSRISPRRKCQRVLLLLMLLALWHPTLSTTNNDTIIRRLCTTPAQIRHGDCKPPEPIADPCEPVYGSGLFSEGTYFPSPAENACLASRERYQAQCNRTGYTLLHNHISKTGGKSLR